MNDTPTTRTDEWETYCDEWYYHLWRLRRKNERGFNDGFHINNGDEAKGLCDLLNNLETELTAAREERDILKSKYADHHAEAEKITSEIKQVTRQRDELKEQLVYYKANNPKGYAAANRYREQRDTLAEALLKIAEGSSCCACRGSVELVSIADKALAAVEGGSDE